MPYFSSITIQLVVLLAPHAFPYGFTENGLILGLTGGLDLDLELAIPEICSTAKTGEIGI